MKKLYIRLVSLLYILLDDSAWRITDADIEDNSKDKCRLIATFEMKKRRRSVCSKCGVLACHQRVGTRRHSALHQIILHGLVHIEVCVKQPLVRCRHCQEQSVCHPQWLQPGKRYTEPFRRLVCYLAHSMSCRAVSRLLGISVNTVRRIDKAVLGKEMPPVDLSKTRRLLVDEKRIGRNCFATIVLDGDTHAVLYFAEGRNSEVLAEFLRGLPKAVKQQIEAVAMDGCRAYRKAVKEELPHARICLDHFHLTRDLLNMFRAALREIGGSELGALQRRLLRWAVKKVISNPREAQSQLDEITASHSINAELIGLVSLFQLSWEQSDFQQAVVHVQNCAALAMRSSIKVVKRFGARIAENAEEIANAISLKLTNGGIEGFNRKIADLLRRGYGYQDVAYLALKVRRLSLPNPTLADFQLDCSY